MDADDSDMIPSVGTHRGVPLHDHQSPARLLTVRAAIDHVYTLEQIEQLVAFAGDPLHAPEARLLAAARVRALWELAQEARLSRPIVDMGRVDALVAGLDSQTWRDPVSYGTLFARDDGGVKREVPLAC